MCIDSLFWECRKKICFVFSCLAQKTVYPGSWSRSVCNQESIVGKENNFQLLSAAVTVNYCGVCDHPSLLQEHWLRHPCKVLLWNVPAAHWNNKSASFPSAQGKLQWSQCFPVVPHLKSHYASWENYFVHFLRIKLNMSSKEKGKCVYAHVYTYLHMLYKKKCNLFLLLTWNQKKPVLFSVR